MWLEIHEQIQFQLTHNPFKIQDSGRRNGTSKSARNGTFGGTDVRLSQNSTGSTGSVSSTPSSTQSSIGTSRRKRIEVSDDEDDPFWD